MSVFEVLWREFDGVLVGSGGGGDLGRSFGGFFERLRLGYILRRNEGRDIEF
jgi:hypothetical protein